MISEERKEQIRSLDTKALIGRAMVAQDQAGDIYDELNGEMQIAIATFNISVGTFDPSPDSTEGKRTSFFVSNYVDFSFLFDESRFFEQISHVRRGTIIVSVYIQKFLRLTGTVTEPGSEPPNA